MKTGNSFLAKHSVLTMLLLVPCIQGQCASVVHGGMTPIGGGLALLLGLSILYTLKKFHRNAGADD